MRNLLIRETKTDHIDVLLIAEVSYFGEWKTQKLKELVKNSFGIPECVGVYSTLILLYLKKLQAFEKK